MKTIKNIIIEYFIIINYLKSQSSNNPIIRRKTFLKSDVIRNEFEYKSIFLLKLFYLINQAPL